MPCFYHYHGSSVSSPICFLAASSPGPAAFAGYAEFNVQGARTGLLPASYLGNSSYQYTNCIGLFAYYNPSGSTPEVQSNLTSLGYNVRRRGQGGGGGPGGAVCLCEMVGGAHARCGARQAAAVWLVVVLMAADVACCCCCHARGMQCA